LEKQNNLSSETLPETVQQSVQVQSEEEVAVVVVEPQTEFTDKSSSTDVSSESDVETNSLSQKETDEVDDKNGNVVLAADKLKHILSLIEAALYVAGRPLDLNELCQVVGSRSKKKVKKYVEIVMQAYVARDSPLEILALKDERYVLQVKAEFTPLIKKLVNRPLLSAGPLKTLSYIAFRQPVTQKRVVEVRGQHAYGHVKLLKDMGLIASERVGRSVGLKTTDYFADYFGLTQDTSMMKRELKRIFGGVSKEAEQP